MDFFDFLQSRLFGKEYVALDIIKQQYPPVRQVFDDCQGIVEILNTLDTPLLSIPPLQPKHANWLMTYLYTESKVNRTTENDRVFPLDTVTLQGFRTNHDTGLETAFIHTGPYANEITRSFNALALTIGRDVFFRSNTYSPGSEEGQKTIVHELTHVSQYEKGEFNNKSHETIEAEAGEAEEKECIRKEDFASINVNGNRYLVERAKIKYYTQKSAEGIKEWLWTQKTILDEKEYFALLCAFNEWLGR